jgi:hypothetical protein
MVETGQRHDLPQRTAFAPHGGPRVFAPSYGASGSRRGEEPRAGRCLSGADRPATKGPLSVQRRQVTYLNCNPEIFDLKLSTGSTARRDCRELSNAPIIYNKQWKILSSLLSVEYDHCPIIQDQPFIFIAHR